MQAQCARCGRNITGEVYHENSATSLCWECYSRTQEEKQLHPSYYRPNPIFYGLGTHFFEVELVLAGDSDGVKACQIMRQANHNRELLYCKRRGGSHKGIIVTSHPMTLDFHLTAMPWKIVLQEIELLDYHICAVKIQNIILS